MQRQTKKHSDIKKRNVIHRHIRPIENYAVLTNMGPIYTQPKMNYESITNNINRNTLKLRGRLLII